MKKELVQNDAVKECSTQNQSKRSDDMYWLLIGCKELLDSLNIEEKRTTEKKDMSRA